MRSNFRLFGLLAIGIGLSAQVDSYSYTIDGPGPSGFDIAKSANVIDAQCGDGNLTLAEDTRFLMQSPGFPKKPTPDESECSWHAELPENSGSTIIFRCDIFHVGRGQESGRCWGDSLSIHSPNNDTLTLCGHRDGIHLTLEGYSEYIEIKYTSKDNSVSDGFSCLLYTEEKNDEEFGGDPDFDYACECGISNEVDKHDSVGDDDDDNAIINNRSVKDETVSDRIIGGKEAKANEYPWQVALVKKGLYKPFCGGSLISDKHVLTAAHCTQDLATSQDFEVLLGEHDLTTALDYSIRMPVSRIIEHPLYNAVVVTNDYAILVLREEVRFTKFLRPVCLPVLSEAMMRSDFANETATLTGWGYTTLKPEPGTDPRAKRLKKLELKVLSHDDCQERWTADNFTMPISPSMICAKSPDPKSSACLGDSGGPLTFKNDQGRHSVIGVVSFGPKTCIDPVIPNVYARVTTVLPWIISYVKQSRLCLNPRTKLLAEAFF